jgi:hypothetical protein
MPACYDLPFVKSICAELDAALKYLARSGGVAGRKNILHRDRRRKTSQCFQWTQRARWYIADAEGKGGKGHANTIQNAFDELKAFTSELPGTTRAIDGARSND